MATAAMFLEVTRLDAPKVFLGAIADQELLFTHATRSVVVTDRLVRHVFEVQAGCFARAFIVDISALGLSRTGM